MKTSGHYTFCTIYGRVCHSFIKHGIQTIQYMINLIKSLFLKVSDKVFIIYPSTVLYNEHSVGRCFQNHIDCGINFAVIKLSFFGKLCVNFMLFCEGLNYKGSSWPYVPAVYANIRWTNLAPQLLLWFCPKLYFQVSDM